MVLALDAAPADVVMPGYFSGSVADATDDQLADQLQASLDVIAEQLARWDAKPTREGYAPPEWLEHAAASRPMHTAESAVRRNQRMAIAIRREQKRRVEAKEAKALADQEQARGELEKILHTAPATSRELAEHAEAVAASTERMRTLLRDLELMAGGVRLIGQHDSLRASVQAAARALGKPDPELAAMPDAAALPTPSEVQTLIAKLAGRGGFDRIRPSQPVGDGEKLARKLRRLEG